jgi:hypothetical protein
VEGITMAAADSADIPTFGKIELDEVVQLARRLTLWADGIQGIPDAVTADLRAASAELLALRAIVLVGMAENSQTLKLGARCPAKMS